jgi:hypothetical protein
MNLKSIFYAEAFINLVTLTLCFFAPATFISQLVTTEYNLFALELTRWYGLVLLILSGILLMALKEKDFRFLRIVLLVNVPGDVIQMVLAIRLAQVFHQWSAALIFTIVFCVLLFVARVAVLLKPKLAGYSNEV